MRKKYVILLYIFFILLAAVGVTTMVWSGIKDKSMDEKLYNNYIDYKEKLLTHDMYIDSIEEIDINVSVCKSNDTYLVSTNFTNPDNNYKNLIILVIDEKELINETDRIYPSIGIVGDFNNEFVTSAPNKKTTHSKLTMNYEIEEISKGVLIYLEYVDNGKKCIVHLRVSATLI